MSNEETSEKMSLSFGTHEALQKKREEDFLLLSGSERVNLFFQMIKESYAMYGDRRLPKDSFEIKKKA